MQVSSKIEVLDRTRSGCDRVVPTCSFGDVSIIVGAGAAHSGAQCVLGFLHYCLVSTVHVISIQEVSHKCPSKV